MSHSGLFDVLVVGGGLAGSAIALNCAHKGLKVGLFEQNQLGQSGATGQSGGIVRIYDPNPALSEMTAAAIPYFGHSRYRGTSAFTKCGALYIADEAAIESVTNCISNHASADYPIELLGVREARRRFPSLRFAPTENGHLVVYERNGGYCRPAEIARICACEFAKLGGTVWESCTDLTITTDRTLGLVLANGSEFRACVVVVAAGTNTSKLVADVSFETRVIPLTIVRESASDISHTMCLVDEVLGGYCRPAGDGLLLVGGGRPIPIGDFDPGASMTAAKILHQKIAHSRFSNRGKAISGRYGADAYTPDYMPIVGFHKGEPPVFIAGGFSGRGAKYMPIIGLRAASEIVSYVKSR